MKRLVILTSLFFGLIVNAKALNNDTILYTGRFDFSDTTRAVFSHVSTSIKANFYGTSITGVFTALDNTSYVQVIIDNNDDISQRKQLQISSKTPKEYILATDLPLGNHQIEIIKTNQYDTKIAFQGFKIEGGRLLAKPPRPAISIEFYGDSNPAGHSAWDPFDRGAVSDNGGYYTYPGITARMLDAEYVNISMGGAGVTNNAWSNLVDFHHLIHMDEPATGSNIWSFTDNHLNFTANAVVINLGANDYYGSASKNDIKKGWKGFITNDLRKYYPDAHIVLANSYGWAFNEPADYVHEAIEELNEMGDDNVSYIRFPWLWGQEHAVVNEHAGFANLLAVHLAAKLELPTPQANELSSFVATDKIYNGSFEKSIISETADGWRPHGDKVSLITNGENPYEGDNFLQLGNGAWINHSNDARAGDEISVSAWIRKTGSGGNMGKLKIEFKDQAQNTISSTESLFAAADEWRQTKATATAPENTWSVWIVLVADDNSIIDFDLVEMADSEPTSFNQMPMNRTNVLSFYPNPSNGLEITYCNKSHECASIKIYDALGNLTASNYLEGMSSTETTFGKKLPRGIYSIVAHYKSATEVGKLIVN